MSRLLQRQKRKPVIQAEPLDEATVRDFNGGLNVIDNDLNLSSRFAKQLINTARAPDGSLDVQFGTKLLADTATYRSGTRIVGTRYFGRFVIAVDNAGEITATDGQGNTVLIWNDTIAASQASNPLGWDATAFVSFVEFNGELIICNGVNKPLLVRPNLNVRYLQDIATGSNINTPVCRYVANHSEYCVMAGDPLAEDMLYISNRLTSGTWLNDPIPNDAVNFPMGSFIEVGSSRITGLASFRDRLVVFFEESIAIVQLGTYDETTGAHVPKVIDVIANYGAISHNAIQNLGEDVLFMDIVGVQSLQRALLTNNLSPDRESRLVDPAIQKRLKRLSRATLEDRVFSVFNKLDAQVTWFVPNDDAINATVETRGFVFTFIKQLKIRAWNEARMWNWSAACRTAEGRVVYARETLLFVYGTQQERFDADYVGYTETYSDDTMHTDGTGFTPVADIAQTGDTSSQGGLPIFFAWELPWSDLRSRGNTKESRYLQLDTQGKARFTAQMFIDNIYKQRVGGEPFTDGTLFTDGWGFENELYGLQPTLSMDFVGGDRGGFGAEAFSWEFGGGRISSDERLYAWPSKFKIFKLRFTGFAKGGLRYIAITMHYMKGAIRR